MSDEKGSHCVWLQGLPPRDLVFLALVRQSTTGIDKHRRRTDKPNLLFLGYLARLEAYEMECPRLSGGSTIRRNDNVKVSDRIAPAW